MVELQYPNYTGYVAISGSVFAQDAQQFGQSPGVGGSIPWVDIDSAVYPAMSGVIRLMKEFTDVLHAT